MARFQYVGSLVSCLFIKCVAMMPRKTALAMDMDEIRRLGRVVEMSEPRGGRGVKSPWEVHCPFKQPCWPPHLTFLHACARDMTSATHPPTSQYRHHLRYPSIKLSRLSTLPFQQPNTSLPSLPLDTPTAKPASTTPQHRHDAQSRSRVAQGHLQQDEEPRPDTSSMVVRTPLPSPSPPRSLPY